MEITMTQVKIVNICAFLSPVIVLVGGCSGDPNGNSEIALAGSPAHIAFHGKSFTWRRTLSSSNTRAASTDSNVVVHEDPFINREKEVTYQASLSELSDAAYAEKLRAVLILNGNEYLADEVPSLAEVSRIRANLESIRGDPSPGPLKTAAVMPDGFAGETLEIHRSPLYSDNRQLQPHNIYPGSTQAYVQTGCPPPNDHNQNCVTECSATLIGPNTALAAAHCFFDPPTQAWLDFKLGRTGLDIFDSPAYSAQFNCFAIAFANAFTTDSSQTSVWDFAVIDFTNCADNPVPASGYMGYWKNISLGSNSVVWATGYPFLSANCFHEQLCGMSGTASGSGSYWLSGNVFVSRGQSGTSLYFEDASHNYYSIGNVVATTTSASYTRKLDSTVYSFLHSYSDPVRFP